jgi:arylsulfatase A-like enzyme
MKLDRRDFLKLIAISGGTFYLNSLLGCSDLDTDERPNIIFFLTDDQRWDSTGFMGNDIIKTPNMDALAQDGVVFENAYVTAAMCAPSRASILSGQYARRHGINDFSKNFSPSAFARTYPVLLRETGYRTGFIGKYGIANDAELPKDQFDYWKGFSGQGHYEHRDEKGKFKHLTQIQEDQAIKFLRSSSNDQPFILSVSFKAPHVQDDDPRQFIYDPQDKNLYQDVVIPYPETSDERFFNSFPEFFRQNNEGRLRWELRFSTPEKYQEMVKGYYRLITGVDRAIGNIRRELSSLGFDKNTIIILSSDNGFYLGEHGLAGKWFGHEESIRVPLLIYDPRLKNASRGQRREEIVLNIDLAPTILTLAGFDILNTMQGRDLTSLILGDAQNWREDFFYENTFQHERIPKSEGVISRRYKYLRYFDQNPVYEQLYDLHNDPKEKRNLVDDAAYQSVLTNMRNRYFELKIKTN